MGKLVGYARVSTSSQDLALQIDALKQAGCANNNIYVDRVSGAKKERPGLQECFKSLHEGDTLLVWRLDRLGRSIVHLVGIVEELRSRKISFKSLCDGAIDTTSASGELIFNIFSSLAQFERKLIQERTHAGLSAARARGRKGGRRPLDPDNPRVKIAKKMAADKSIEVRDICKSLKISRSTFYRWINY